MDVEPLNLSHIEKLQWLRAMTKVWDKDLHIAFQYGFGVLSSKVSYAAKATRHGQDEVVAGGQNPRNCSKDSLSDAQRWSNTRASA